MNNHILNLRNTVDDSIPLTLYMRSKPRLYDLLNTTTRQHRFNMKTLDNLSKKSYKREFRACDIYNGDKLYYTCYIFPKLYSFNNIYEKYWDTNLNLWLYFDKSLSYMKDLICDFGILATNEGEFKVYQCNYG